MAYKPLDVLKLSDEIEQDSQSGALHQILLEQGNTLYEPDPEMRDQLRRQLPSGEIERGYFRDGDFVITATIYKGPIQE